MGWGGGKGMGWGGGSIMALALIPNWLQGAIYTLCTCVLCVHV